MFLQHFFFWWRMFFTNINVTDDLQDQRKVRRKGSTTTLYRCIWYYEIGDGKLPPGDRRVILMYVTLLVWRPTTEKLSRSDLRLYAAGIQVSLQFFDDIWVNRKYNQVANSFLLGWRWGSLEMGNGRYGQRRRGHFSISGIRYVKFESCDYFTKQQTNLRVNLLL